MFVSSAYRYASKPLREVAFVLRPRGGCRSALAARARARSFLGLSAARPGAGGRLGCGARLRGVRPIERTAATGPDVLRGAPRRTSTSVSALFRGNLLRAAAWAVVARDRPRGCVRGLGVLEVCILARGGTAQLPVSEAAYLWRAAVLRRVRAAAASAMARTLPANDRGCLAAILLRFRQVASCTGFIARVSPESIVHPAHAPPPRLSTLLRGRRRTVPDNYPPRRCGTASSR